MSFKDKVVLVTGASRGIGAAIATQFAQQGAYVIGTATSQDGAEKITAMLQQHGQGEGFKLNVTDSADIEALFKHLDVTNHMPDILVNNAGITRDNLMMRMSDTDWQAVISTNLNALFTISKNCIRTMMKKRWGRIISIGSVVASAGNPGQANYCAAKAGVIGFSKSLAYEVASRNITVNVIAPGFIQTDMTDKLTDQQKEAILTKVAAQRLGQPEDIANAVLFVASEGASYMTGQTLHINGGMYMN